MEQERRPSRDGAVLLGGEQPFPVRDRDKLKASSAARARLSWLMRFFPWHAEARHGEIQAASEMASEPSSTGSGTGALRSALKRGLIDRGRREVCGAEQTDGHHYDYERPIVVRWLCHRHHRAEHKKSA